MRLPSSRASGERDTREGRGFVSRCRRARSLAATAKLNLKVAWPVLGPARIHQTFPQLHLLVGLGVGRKRPLFLREVVHERVAGDALADDLFRVKFVCISEKPFQVIPIVLPVLQAVEQSGWVEGVV